MEDETSQDVTPETATEELQSETPAEPEPAKDEESAVQKRIDELTRKRYEAERRAQEAERKLKEATANRPETDDEKLSRMIEERAAKMIAERETQSKMSAWDSKGRAEIPDFLDKCNTVAEMGAGNRPDFMEALLDLDDSQHIVAALADDPDKLAAILAMPPHRMGAALARVQPKQVAKPSTPISKAPPPPKSIDTTAGGGRSVNDMSVAEQLEYIRSRNR